MLTFSQVLLSSIRKHDKPVEDVPLKEMQGEKTALTLPLQYQSYQVLSTTTGLQSSLDNSGWLLIFAPPLCPALARNWLESVS